MTSPRKMKELWPFGAILRGLNNEILLMTSFSLSTFHDLSDVTVKIKKLLLTGICTESDVIEKWRKKGPKPSLLPV